MEDGVQSIGNVRSRWNPTKEQISMLEGIYKQGLKNPSIEQIHQITARLEEVGHVEGRNVFYWFQNRKARQRQKQKQEENSASIDHLYHFTSFPFAPYHNEKCALLESSSPVISPVSADSQRHNHMMHSNKCEQETLELFPLHPTGILQAKDEGKKEDGKNHEDWPFYDFFSGSLN